MIAVFRAVREALVSWDHSADYPLPKSKDWTSAGGAAGFTKTWKLGEEHSRGRWQDPHARKSSALFVANGKRDFLHDSACFVVIGVTCVSSQPCKC